MNGNEVLIISIGKVKEHTIYSLRTKEIKYVIFVVSSEDSIHIERIKRQSKVDFIATEQIYIDDTDNINECYKRISRKIKIILDRWNMDPENVIVDFSEGSRPMIAALVLATIEDCSKYCYIGGIKRESKTNRIIRSVKKSLCSSNPWNELGINELNKVDLLFEKARYQSAVDILEELIKKVSIERRDIFKIIRDIVSIYLSWDAFKHEEAYKKVQNILPRIKKYKLINQEWFEKIIRRLERENEILNNICNDRNRLGKYLIVDLISNALRRINNESKFDDAVARLYSSLERIAKYRLISKYSIDNSATKQDQIPQDIREFFKDYYFINGIKYYRYGFKNSFELLYSLGDKIGIMYFNNKSEIIKIMNSRNNSILAHGYDPVNKEFCNMMFRFVLKIGEINEGDLYRFEKLNLKSLIL